MNIIDRYVLRQFVKNFTICFVSLIGVFVIFDACSNYKQFDVAKGLDLVKVMAMYYGCKSLFFFDVISSELVVISASLTMVWIQANHQLTALMAAGISRIRVVTPVLVASSCVVALAVVNREIAIPQVKDQVARRPSEGNVIPELQRRNDDATDVLIGGRNAMLDQNKIELPIFDVHQNPALSAYGYEWSAHAAYFQQADGNHPTGYKLLGIIQPGNLPQRASLAYKGRPILLTPRDCSWLKSDEAFVASDVSVDHLTGGMVLRDFGSTSELIWAVKNHIFFGAYVPWRVHSRILQPLLDVTLLFLCFPLMAALDNRDVLKAVIVCVLMMALFLLYELLLSMSLATNGILSPALAAWVPLMVFVPAAVRISTVMWRR